MESHLLFMPLYLRIHERCRIVVLTSLYARSNKLFNITSTYMFLIIFMYVLKKFSLLLQALNLVLIKSLNFKFFYKVH